MMNLLVLLDKTIKELRELYDRWALPTNMQITMWELEDLHRKLTGV